jgi:hypothetical protein
VIKTRMQSLEARTQYRNSFHCAARILSEEGVLRFWRGATPRLARLVLSGGIVFTVYEKGESSLGALSLSLSLCLICFRSAEHDGATVSEASND